MLDGDLQQHVSFGTSPCHDKSVKYFLSLLFSICFHKSIQLSHLPAFLLSCGQQHMYIKYVLGLTIGNMSHMYWSCNESYTIITGNHSDCVYYKNNTCQGEKELKKKT